MRPKNLLDFRKTLSLLGMISAMALTGPTPAYAVQLTAETGSSPTSVQASVATTEFAEELSRQSDGEITVDITYGGARAKLTEMADAVSSGILQLGVIATSYTPGKFPMWAILPVSDFRLTTGGDLVAVNAIAATLLNEFPELEEEVARQNMKIVGFMPVDELVLITNQPIAKLDDLKGKKIRGSVESAVRTLNYSGASGISLPWAEVHTSLQTNLLDGVWTNAGWILSTKTHEVAKNTTYVDIRAALPTVFLAMNLDTYNSLSDEQKAALEETYRSMLVTAGKLIEEERRAALETFENDPTVTHKELPSEERNAWLDATPDFLDEVAAELDAKGYPGTAITKRMKELYEGYNNGTWDPLEAISNAKL
jgi:TRAP-type transport system periplasmic protein